ncbi:pancreatic lipase-related protein 2-like [Diachasmimorpha longicaudata]|uniref:pancreatic lipase-related protein 2-like n=1 Tax=Diachasmimorpha longicaudata TaxID=58733 RepID=UPI0030B8F542
MCAFSLLVWSLMLGIVNAQNILNSNFEFMYRFGNLTYFNRTRFRRDKGSEFVCPTNDITSKLATFLQLTVADFRIITAIERDISNLITWTHEDEDDSIVLSLYVRSKNEVQGGQITKSLRVDIAEMKKIGFDPKKKTVFVSHGFLASGRVDWMDRMMEAYLGYEDVNFIMVEWYKLSNIYRYIDAAKNTVTVANQVRDLAKEIVAAYPAKTKWGEIHLIGFSLGSHVVGMIGNHFKDPSNAPLTQWRVARITGLDPAHPCFTDSQFSLSKNDAPFVDIIHTSGNRQMGMTLGMAKPIGHVDFYVNGGEIQPGCAVHLKIVPDTVKDWARKLADFLLKKEFPEFEWFVDVGEWILGKITETDTYKDLEDFLPNLYVGYCSHVAAPELFIESLDLAAAGGKSSLTGIEWNYDVCDALSYVYTHTCNPQRKCQKFGIKAQPGVQGIFFVPTAKHAPYHELNDDDVNEISVELERLRSEGKPRYM